MAVWVGIGVSTNKEPSIAGREAAERAMLKVIKRSKIDFAFVFSTVGLSTISLLKPINKILGGIPLIGCSTAAIISNLGISRHGVIVIAVSFDDVTWNIAHVNNIRSMTPLVSGEELGNRLIYGYMGKFYREMGLILCDGMSENISILLRGLQEKLGLSFPIVGAAASDNFRFLRTYLYYNETIYSDSAIGLLLGGKIKFGLGIRHGWRPLGKLRTVTAASGNTIHSIDDKPAASVYQEYCGLDMAKLKKELPMLASLYPIGIYMGSEKEYLLRTIRTIKDDGSLVCQGDVAQGCEIRLMIGTKETCVEAARQAARQAKATTIRSLFYAPDETESPVKLALIFDSIARYTLLGKNAIHEIEAVCRELGPDVPIAGFYTFGEQSPIGTLDALGRTHLHNQTISILTFKG